MKITTENIQVGFHARQILKGISMESKDKELVGIIGPNGSGKSIVFPPKHYNFYNSSQLHTC